MATKIGYVSDWVARLKTRLYTQWRHAVTWNQWCELLGSQFQDLEDAFQSLLTMASIDDSEGVQLDVIGRIVGQPRAGAIDVTYRLYLKGRIAANRSTGTPENIYSVFRAMLGTPTMSFVFGAVKEFMLYISSVVDNSTALVGMDMLHDAKESGARGVLKWQEYPAAEIFTYDTGPGYDVGHFANALQV